MIKLFSEIGDGDHRQVGGKALHQARLWQQRFNVPPGVVITAQAFTQFIAAQGLADDLRRLDAEPALATRLQSAIEQATLPAELFTQLQSKLSEAFPAPPRYGFAVRSSALGEDSEGHSFAGIHSTLLGMARAELSRAILACWASAFSARAIDYRRERALTLGTISVAVLIQPLLNPHTAGVAFTLDPVSGNRDEMIINATYGLGEMLVSGAVEPDTYRVKKGSPPLILDRIPGTKAEQLVWRDGRIEKAIVAPAVRVRFALSDAQIVEIGGKLELLEAAFGAPQDVEWAYQDDELFILQSRPITAAPSKPKIDIEWSRVNFREIVPELPSPYCTGLLKMSEPDFAVYYHSFGFQGEDLRPILKVIYGRPYFNISMFKLVADTTGLPIEVTMRMWGHDQAFKSRADYSIDYRRLLSNLPIVLRASFNQLRTVPIARKFIKDVDAELEAIESLDADSLDYKNYFAFMEARHPYYCAFLYNAMNIGSAILGKLILIIQAIGDALPVPENFINVQMAAGEKNISAQQGLDLLALGEEARKDERARNYFAPDRERFDDFPTALAGTKLLSLFEDFIARYGHRGMYETDPAQPRYHEQPEYLLYAIRNMVNGRKFTAPAEVVAQHEEQAAREWRTLEQQLRAQSRLAFLRLALIRRQLRELKRLLALRERVRSEGVRVIAAMRIFHLRLAERLVREGYLEARDDYFMLDPQDLVNALSSDPTALKKIVAQRKARHAFYAKLEMPNLLRESEIADLVSRTTPAAVDNSSVFQGLAVSPGVIEGEVVVLRSPAEFPKMQPGRILVAPATDPAWTPLFTNAIGVIVEMGGMLSHGSIVAREYGLPTVVNIPGITKRLRDGDRVRVDGSAGIVEII